MVYIPTPPNTLLPGFKGNDSKYGILLSNMDGAYMDYAPPLIDSTVDIQVDSETPAMVAEWVVGENLDQARIAVAIRWVSTAGNKAYAYLTLTDGVNTDTSGTYELEGDVWTVDVLTLSPSASLGPLRYARLWLSTSTAGQRAKVNQLSSWLWPEYVPTARTTAGFAYSAIHWTGANLPVCSEVVERQLHNLSVVTIDRPATLAGGIGSVAMSSPLAGPSYTASGTDWTLIDSWIQPHSDFGRRRYHWHISTSGDSPEWRMTIGGVTLSGTSGGWEHYSQEATLPEGTRGYLYLRSGSGGNAKCHTWQLTRGTP